MSAYKIASRFVTRIVVGSILAILIGLKIDSMINTTPLVMIILLIYVICGSLILLVKEITYGRKSEDD